MPPQTPMSPADLITTAAEVASKDDRWLFIFVTFLFLASLLAAIHFVTKHFTSRCLKLEAKVDAMQEQHLKYVSDVGVETLKTLVSAQNTLSECAKSLENNSKINDRTLEFMRQIEGFMTPKHPIVSHEAQRA